MEQDRKLNQRSTSAKNRNLSCRAKSRPRIQVGRLPPIARGRFGEPPLPEAVSRADRRSVWWPIPNSAREFQTRFASEELRPPTAYTQARPNSALPFSLAEQTWR